MKERIDILLVERRLVESRTKAQWLIRNGHVLVNGIKINKPGKKVDNNCLIELKKQFPYVGIGGLKLEAALKSFSIDVKNKVCADIGASIGGFTDCLLKRGALKVYAVDTATDLLHPSLKCNETRVVKLLGIDARKLTSMDEEIDLVTIDITFTSLKNILINVKNYLSKNGDIIALIKPIFESTPQDQKKFKIIKDPLILRDIIINLIEWCHKSGLYTHDVIKSPILGKKGSIEFLIHLKLYPSKKELDLEKKIRSIIIT
ncbi:MAG: TlyA family RNA methyltransferase [Promethearchaeota archaeon]